MWSASSPRSSASSTAAVFDRGRSLRTASSPRCSSPTSSTRPSALASLATPGGGSCSSDHHAARSARARPRPRERGGHGRRRLLRRVRRAGPRRSLREVDRRRSARARARRSLRPPHRRVRARRRQDVTGSPSTPGRASPRMPAPGEVLVSSTVKDLVAGSGLEFEDRGSTSSRASRASGGSTPPSDGRLRRATRGAATSTSPTRSSATGRSTSSSCRAGSRTSSSCGTSRVGAVPRAPRVLLAADPVRQARDRACPTACRTTGCRRSRSGWTTCAPCSTRSARSAQRCFGHSEGGNMCVLFAATYPERTTALVTLGSFAKRRDPDDDYPWAPTAENRETLGARTSSSTGATCGRRTSSTTHRAGSGTSSSCGISSSISGARRARVPQPPCCT